MGLFIYARNLMLVAKAKRRAARRRRRGPHATTAATASASSPGATEYEAHGAHVHRPHLDRDRERLAAAGPEGRRPGRSEFEGTTDDFPPIDRRASPGVAGPGYLPCRILGESPGGNGGGGDGRTSNSRRAGAAGGPLGPARDARDGRGDRAVAGPRQPGPLERRGLLLGPGRAPGKGREGLRRPLLRRQHGQVRPDPRRDPASDGPARVQPGGRRRLVGLERFPAPSRPRGGARPSTVVVDFDRTILQAAPIRRTCRSPGPTWSTSARPSSSAWRCATPTSSPGSPSPGSSPRSRTATRSAPALRAGLRGEATGRRANALQLRRNWTLNRGALVNARGSFQDFPAPDATEYREGTWRPHPAHARFVRRFLERAASRGIDVVWLLPPVSPGTQAIWESWGDEARFESFARALLARHPNLLVLDGRHSGYDASVFHDAVHLDRDGAHALSVTVADLLARGALSPTGPTRWLALPAFRTPDAPFPLEDLAQSGAAVLRALDEGGKRRR